MNAPGPAEQEIWQRTADFATRWISQRQGSPVELIRGLEDEVGWRARHIVLGVLDELRDEKELSAPDRKYLTYTLNAASIKEALAEGTDPITEYQSSLDDLFTRSRRFRRSKKFAEAVEFVAKFHEYSPYNNELVYSQNPMTTHFATASHWVKMFGRAVKEEARGMVILAPKTPVLLVYDISDTVGPPLPKQFEVFGRTLGRFNPLTLQHTLANCEQQKICVQRLPLAQLRAGFATRRVSDQKYKMRIGLREKLDDAAAYAALCHELAHIFLGHVGTDKDRTWPYRLNLSNAVMEIEAEAVAHIVCCRTGLKTYSAEYLSSYVGEETELESISFDLVCRVASRIETMGKRLITPKDETTVETGT